MRETEFKAWMTERGLGASTISTYLSQVRLIERHYGDIDDAYAENGLAALKAEFEYSSQDEAAGRPNPSRITHLPDLNRDLSNLRTIVSTYESFARGDPAVSIRGKLTAEHVTAVLDECDAMGMDAFLARYGFQVPKRYWLVRDGKRYPSKAIIGVAQKFVNGGKPFGPGDLSGGLGPTGAARIAQRLGFEIVENAEDRSGAVWFVTARDGDVDGLSGFVERGEWSLLHEGRYSDKVREMRPGDRIVMRDYTSRSVNPPFETHGVAVSSMLIRATGTIAANRNDGLSVAVDWDALPEARTWYFYTSNETIWRLPSVEQAAKLCAFAFDGEPQDHAWWLAQPYWRDRIAGRGSVEEQTVTPSDPVNLILYGPPGTGKTYATAREAVRLCTDADIVDRAEVMLEYRRLSEEGRIEFVTFHQSYAYEDFVEGLRPSQGSEAAGFSLEPVPGVFRRIVQRAQASKGGGTDRIDLANRRVFKMSIGDATRADRAYLFDKALEEGYTFLGYEDIDWTDDRFASQQTILDECRSRGVRDGKLSPQSGPVEGPHRFRNEMQVGDIIVVTKGLKLFRALGEVIGAYEYAPTEDGEYCHRRKVRWLWSDAAGVPFEEIKEKQFSQETIYPLRKADLKLPALERYANSGAGGAGAPEPFVIIIDEINRANISKVFGELIALIETDKRIGMLNELTVRLPYSRDLFGVPANLHIVGTMNTADRSIALLDTALRRRFEFRELMPDPAVLDIVDGIDLAAVLRGINARIEYLFDREHQIGHAYFYGCRDKAAIDATMRFKVIPLLAEYFYEDWQKVALILGDADGRGGFLRREILKAPPGLDADSEGAERWRWSLADAFSREAYARLGA